MSEPAIILDCWLDGLMARNDLLMSALVAEEAMSDRTTSPLLPDTTSCGPSCCARTPECFDAHCVGSKQVPQNKLDVRQLELYLSKVLSQHLGTLDNEHTLYPVPCETLANISWSGRLSQGTHSASSEHGEHVLTWD